MAILACGGATYARLRFNTGSGGELRLDMGVDYTVPFAAADHDAWRAEYAACVRPEPEFGTDLEAEEIGGSSAGLRSSALLLSDPPFTPPEGEEVFYLR